MAKYKKTAPTAIDFGAITGDIPEVKVSGDSFPFMPTRANGNNFDNGEGKELIMHLFAVDSTMHEKAIAVMRLHQQAKMRKTGLKDVDDMTETEIDAAIKSDEDSTCDYMARMTSDWNIVHNGEPVPYSIEAGKQFYATAKTIRAECDSAMVNEGKERKKSLPGL